MQAAVVFLGFSLLLAGCAADPDGGDAPVRPHLATAVVAASNLDAAEAGAVILRSGGNYVDAAAAVQFALNVVEPPMSGIGGGAFLVLHDATTKTTRVIDGRETAPAASTPDQFLTPAGEPQPFSTAHMQGYAVGVPGTLMAWATAVAQSGNLSLEQVLQPAIRLAADGFSVSPDLARILRDPATEAKLKSWPASAIIYYPGTTCPGAGQPGVGNQPACVFGDPPAAGDVLVNPDLAATLSMIASSGAEAFYTGPVAQAIVAAVGEREGRMTIQDLGAYAVAQRDPLFFSYGEYEVATMPPPGGGLIMAQILRLLEPMPIGSAGPITPDALHAMIEVKHLAYADRAVYLADADHVPVPVQGMLSGSYLAMRRAGIDMAQANDSVAAGDPWKHQGDGSGSTPAGRPNEFEGRETTHYVVVDHWGNVASVTTTLESGFGSGITVPGYGFTLNNEMTDFDFRPGGANQVEPGKRPRSSMSPSIAFRDGQAVLAVGSPGGPTIITSVAQTTWYVMQYALDAQEAVATPNVYSPSYPTVSWEAGINQVVRDALGARGHDLGASPSVIGNVQAAQRDSSGAWVGVVDSSRSGAVVYVAPV